MGNGLLGTILGVAAILVAYFGGFFKWLGDIIKDELAARRERLAKRPTRTRVTLHAVPSEALGKPTWMVHDFGNGRTGTMCAGFLNVTNVTAGETIIDHAKVRIRRPRAGINRRRAIDVRMVGPKARHREIIPAGAGVQYSLNFQVEPELPRGFEGDVVADVTIVDGLGNRHEIKKMTFVAADRMFR